MKTFKEYLDEIVRGYAPEADRNTAGNRRDFNSSGRPTTQTGRNKLAAKIKDVRKATGKSGVQSAIVRAGANDSESKMYVSDNALRHSIAAASSDDGKGK